MSGRLPWSRDKYSLTNPLGGGFSLLPSVFSMFVSFVFLIQNLLTLWLKVDFFCEPSLHKKWGFQLRISSINVTGFLRIWPHLMQKSSFNGKLHFLWSAKYFSDKFESFFLSEPRHFVERKRSARVTACHFFNGESIER